MVRARIALLATVALLPETAASQTERARYTLSRPTPWAEARDLSTDRPDLTESPYTVPAGRVQFEVDLVRYTRDVAGTGSARTRYESLAIAPVNVKVGLLHDVDFQLVLETYVRDRQRLLTGTTGSTSSQFGAMTGRVKVNLRGNDGGRTAVAIMPFLSFVPEESSGGRYVNGGVILPVAIDLGGGFGFGTMAELDFERSDLTRRHHAVFINSVTVGRDIGADFGTYVEFFSGRSTETGSRWVASFGLGFTKGLGANVQLDAGANLGVSRAADGFNPFLGLSFRL